MSPCLNMDFKVILNKSMQFCNNAVAELLHRRFFSSFGRFKYILYAKATVSFVTFGFSLTSIKCPWFKNAHTDFNADFKK
jgi:predicted small integral membrane protein